MSELSFHRNYTQVIQGTQSCLDQKLLMPALILIYTLIDTLAWASSDKKQQPVRTQFETWVNEWVGSQLPCTATELYAARCAILHTLTSQAKLHAGGSIRQVVYAWGIAKSEDLQEAINIMEKTDLVAVHVNLLFQTVREGMANMLQKAETDPALAKRLKEAADLHLTNESPEVVAAYLNVRGAS